MRVWSTLFPSGKSPRLVLVAGCGTGDLIAEFANSHPRVQFVGMDLSEAIYENAREHIRYLTRLGIQDIGVPISKFETGCSLASDTTAIETLSCPTTSVSAPHGAAWKGSLHSITFVLFDNIAPKYQYQHSESEAEAWYREENFLDGFKVLWVEAYVATKAST
jgi:SAM-dependent methyltransferase